MFGLEKLADVMAEFKAQNQRKAAASGAVKPGDCVECRLQATFDGRALVMNAVVSRINPDGTALVFPYRGSTVNQYTGIEQHQFAPVRRVSLAAIVRLGYEWSW